MSNDDKLGLAKARAEMLKALNWLEYSAEGLQGVSTHVERPDLSDLPDETFHRMLWVLNDALTSAQEATSRVQAVVNGLLVHCGQVLPDEPGADPRSSGGADAQE